MKKNPLIAVTVVLALALAAGAGAESLKYKGFARGEALITPQELKGLIDAKDPKLVVIAVASVPQYFEGHIPGSIQMWRGDYEAPADTMGGVTDNLLQPEGFTKLMQGFGVDPDSTVVVYDYQYDATRVWWAFYYYGKTDVRVLDGGIQGWRDAGYETDMFSRGKATHKGTWVAKVTFPTMRVDTPEILGLKDRTDAQLWDNRGNAEFCGDTIKKGAFRAGRIPWDVQCDWPNFMTKSNEMEWLNAAEMQKVLDKFGFDLSKQQYFICQSGVRTTHGMFALYLMGWPVELLHNYDSSWIGWSKDSSLPIEKGCPDLTPAPWQKAVAEKK
jgi:thiosulfate/3-mercaptopyruvate sulfurtransferase